MVDILYDHNSGVRNWSNNYWPYLLFVLGVIIHNYFFLSHGYNATDEGYLQSLAQRIVDGEQPYKDFYFFRTPLSLYLQAGLMWIFGNHYTILAARWLWSFQIIVMIILLSSFYRKETERYEQFLILCTSWVVSSLLITFFWYSYDAVFFAVIAAFFLFKRQYFLVGAAMFLSALSKQNYTLLLPLFVLATGLIQWRWREIKILDWPGLLKLGVGFTLPTIVFMAYIEIYGGGINPFYWNIVNMPRLSSHISTMFALFQNNDEAFLKAIPVMLAVILGSIGRIQKHFRFSLVIVATTFAIVQSVSEHRIFIYQLVYLNYSLSILALVRGFQKQTNSTATFTTLLPILIVGIIIQYLAGYNYSGLMFSYIGVATGLVASSICLLSFDKSSTTRSIFISSTIIVCGVGLFHKYDFVARDNARSMTTSDFKSHKLSGLSSSPRNVAQLDDLVATINNRTQEDDYIFVFPDFPSLYYLTGRKNPTRVGWYFIREFTVPMINEAITDLARKRPPLILLQLFPESDFRRERGHMQYWNHEKFRSIYNWIVTNYRPIDTVGDVVAFMQPNKSRDLSDDLAYYRNRINAAPGSASSATAWYKLGCFFDDSGQYDSAFYYLQQAVKLNPQDIGMVYRLSLFNAKHRRYNLAMSGARFMAKLKPNDYKTIFGAGVIFMKCLELEKAQSLFLSAFTLNPRSFSSAANLSEIYLRRRLPDSSIVWSKRANDLKEDQPVIYGNLVRAFLILGRKQEAEQAMNRYRQLENDARRVSELQNLMR